MDDRSLHGGLGEWLADLLEEGTAHGLTEVNVGQGIQLLFAAQLEFRELVGDGRKCSGLTPRVRDRDDHLFNSAEQNLGSTKANSRVLVLQQAHEVFACDPTTSKILRSEREESLIGGDIEVQPRSVRVDLHIYLEERTHELLTVPRAQCTVAPPHSQIEQDH